MNLYGCWQSSKRFRHRIHPLSSMIHIDCFERSIMSSLYFMTFHLKLFEDDNLKRVNDLKLRIYTFDYCTHENESRIWTYLVVWSGISTSIVCFEICTLEMQDLVPEQAMNNHLWSMVIILCLRALLIKNALPSVMDESRQYFILTRYLVTSTDFHYKFDTPGLDKHLRSSSSIYQLYA